jgi:proteasome assembly chaperone (PAC2) family protein
MLRSKDKSVNIMKFIKVEEPHDIHKPVIIAAMQDMGNVGSIAIDLINKNLKTHLFRYVSPPSPNYVVDNGGYIDFQQETWEYRYTKDTIVFGGGAGQPQTNQELYELCQDIMDIAKMHSAQLIYTLGAFHTTRNIDKKPETFITTTSRELTEQVKKLGIQTTPQSSLITGFNGLILGFAKLNNIQGIGLYGELNDPRIQQYRTAKSVLQVLERLTYQKFGSFEELDVMAEAVDKEIDRMKKLGEFFEK